MELGGDWSGVIEERLGAARAQDLQDELAAAGLVAVDVAALAELERQAAGYRRLASLAEQPDA